MAFIVESIWIMVLFCSLSSSKAQSLQLATRGYLVLGFGQLWSTMHLVILTFHWWLIHWWLLFRLFRPLRSWCQIPKTSLLLGLFWKRCWWMFLLTMLSWMNIGSYHCLVFSLLLMNYESWSRRVPNQRGGGERKSKVGPYEVFKAPKMTRKLVKKSRSPSLVAQEDSDSRTVTKVRNEYTIHHEEEDTAATS